MARVFRRAWFWPWICYFGQSFNIETKIPPWIWYIVTFVGMWFLELVLELELLEATSEVIIGQVSCHTWLSFNAQNSVTWNDTDFRTIHEPELLSKGQMMTPWCNLKTTWQGDKHPLRGRHGSPMKVAHWSPLGQYLVSFKGKRYLNGIGSETRNSLHYIHDGQRSVMLTTWRHGKNWEKNCLGSCDSFLSWKRCVNTLGV